MARTKQELAKEIEVLFSQGGQVKTLDEAAKARTRLSEALAEKIDAYVQYQIGARLEGILTAVAATGSTGVSIPLVEGSTFRSLIRKE